MTLAKLSSRIPAPWYAGILWLGWNVIGGLLPLWGTALILLLFGKSLDYYDFLKNGEFVLYAAAFVGGGMYSIRRDVFPFKNVFNVFLCIILVVSTLIFAVISIRMLGDTKHLPNMSPDVLTLVSTCTLSLAIVLCFILTITEENGSGFDIPDRMKRGGKELFQSFDDLLKTQQEAKTPKGAGND